MADAAFLKVVLGNAQEALGAQLRGEEPIGGDVILRQLFQTGHTFGFTEQEIAQALVEPVREMLQRRTA